MVEIAKGYKTITRVDDGYSIVAAPSTILVPTNYDGTNPVFTGAKARVLVTNALGESLTVTITSITPTGCTATYSGNELTITGFSYESIGGRNLLLNSKNERSYTNTYPLNIATFELNTEYTISFDAKIVSGNPLFHVEFHGGIKAKDFTLTNNYVRYSHTLNTNSEYGILYFWLTSSGEVSLKNIKVEKGNKATDWTPAPEDYCKVDANGNVEISYNEPIHIQQFALISRELKQEEVG